MIDALAPAMMSLAMHVVPLHLYPGAQSVSAVQLVLQAALAQA
jgi:hypothetical protein